MATEPASDGGPFAELLRQHRAAANLTQEELSERSGVSVHAISMLERGVRRSPRPSTVEFLAGALRLDRAQREALVAAAHGRPSTPAATAAATRTLPRDVAAFTGRTAELDRLLVATEAGPAAWIVAIDGMAGVGKTAFAVHAAHLLAPRFPDGQLFLDLHGHTAGQRPVAPAEALGALLLAAGVRAQVIPPDLDGRAALWRDRSAGRRFLVLIDDAAGAEQVRPLLPGGSGCVVLITSRRRLASLEDVEPLTLGTLPPDQAVELFARLAGGAGRTGEPAAVAEVVARCQGLPLAIGLLAGRLRSHPSWTVGHLAGTVRDTRDGLAELYAGDRSVEAAIDLSVRAQSEDLRRLFGRLGLHPGPDVDAWAAAALDGADLATARRRLDALYTDHLIDEPLPGRYRFHDLVRARARALAPLDDAAGARLLDYHVHVAGVADRRIAQRGDPAGPPAEPFPGPVPDLAARPAAAAWLEAERANLDAWLEHAAAAGRHGHVVRLAHAMHTLLRTTGHWGRALAVHRTGLTAARLAGDRLGEAGALVDLGIIRRLTADYPTAAAAFTEALDLYRELDSGAGVANAMNELGALRCLMGEYDAASGWLTAAVAAFRELDDRLGLAAGLGHLGVLRSVTGDYDAAVAALVEAISLFRELGDRVGLAGALRDLGVARYASGVYPPAAAALTEATAIFRESGDRLGLANCLKSLGGLRILTCEPAEATAALTEAIALYRELGSPFGLANALSELGKVQQQTGDDAAAMRSLAEALGAYDEIGSRRGRANVLEDMGIVQGRTGQHAAALASLTEALALHREDGSGVGQADVLNALGMVRLGAGDHAGADAALREALALFRELGDRRGQAESLNNLGELLRATGRAGDAADHHRQALDLARELGSRGLETRARAGIEAAFRPA